MVHGNAAFLNPYSFCLQRGSISSPVASPQLDPEATHIPCTSLKPKDNIKKQQRSFLKKGWGNILCLFLRFFQIKACKKLWQKQQQQQTLDTGNLLGPAIVWLSFQKGGHFSLLCSCSYLSSPTPTWILPKGFKLTKTKTNWQKD